MTPKKRPTSLAAKATIAGKSTAAFAKMNVHSNSLVGKQARLYYAKEGLHGGGKATMDSGGDKRTASTRLYQAG